MTNTAHSPTPALPFRRTARRAAVARTAALGAALALTLTACATADPAAAPAAEEVVDSDVREVGSPDPRAVISYDGGVLVVDAGSLEVLADISLDEPVRIAPAGDGRHVALNDASGIRMLDTGTWTESHDDHGHSYVSDPAMTEVAFPMSEPGHVVPHGDRTALFSDGDGTVTVLDPHDIADGDPETEVVTLPTAHHGVAVVLEDGTLVVTEGTEEDRTTVVAQSADGAELARTDECPRVHGETAAADEHLVFGCAGGVVVYGDGAFTTVAAPDAAASIGTARGTEQSPIVLTNYAIEGDDTARVALVDTVAGTMRLVELPAAYASTGLAMTDAGTGLVVGTDGVLRAIDAETGAITSETPVVAEWEVPEDYTEPRPSVTVLGGLAWITEPATDTVHIVDLDELAVIDSIGVPQTPNQLVVVSG
ncbi:hypothetical protein OVN18_08115 [Microcella daejeonensis]|uniref:Secreted protein n=1 Tax=Microcella daejeonensis TaxID=2994971 RepID=A0A9E8MJ77_9MICO|nr:hypothetical protein [Microcella daejeonensis]WAB80538.1 hypothetical protein OVN18_08115 [Microcella daejeonensis]